MSEEYYQTICEMNIKHYTGEIPYYTSAPLRDVEARLLEWIPSGANILDLGCGSGRFSVRAAQCGFSITGLDITPRAIEAAKQWAREEEIHDASFLVADMSDIPFDCNAFDFVFCPRFSINALSTFERRKRAVAEMIRVVRRGGRVFIESFNYFYLGKGPLFLAKNIVRDIRRRMNIWYCNMNGNRYSGLLPGDITYPSNKVEGAPDGYAHIPSVLEIWLWMPTGIKWSMHSTPEICTGVSNDPFKFVRYSIWLILGPK